MKVYKPEEYIRNCNNTGDYKWFNKNSSKITPTHTFYHVNCLELE